MGERDDDTGAIQLNGMRTRRVVERIAQKLEAASLLRESAFRQLVRVAKDDREALVYVKPEVARRVEEQLGFTPSGGLKIPARHVRAIGGWLRRRLEAVLDRALGGMVGGGVVMALWEWAKTVMHGR